MILFKPSTKGVCDFCGGMYFNLKDLSTLDDVTVTMCRHCREDLVTALINITVD